MPLGRSNFWLRACPSEFLFYLCLGFLACGCFCEGSRRSKPNAISSRLRDWLAALRSQQEEGTVCFIMGAAVFPQLWPFLYCLLVCQSKISKEATTVVRAPDAERAVVCSSLLHTVWRWRRAATKAGLNFHLTYFCSCVQSQDPAQKQSQAILKFLPLMIGYFSLSVPSGLSLYW